jgi:hypothetical protein
VGSGGEEACFGVYAGRREVGMECLFGSEEETGRYDWREEKGRGVGVGRY